mmetsp:Transcript_31024/g.66039  ORF Transcript_31024/g.66039 Transcript_31024/m.66039 type:complete len:227 (-) Transcript_31024:188-868(-)|eukprot:CAMPEP_0172528494 /NCGR_PEP_ID=MMETSP1067-20121228/2877_1 /TAXON_ID=265564 ORGANISM="Thalassiosira punctigera, Strain Tpunct2005C2" /NCGR_SAMPLE_ID=MMETSP1067 /ASSEMBLY_ACC=CAM_ASM_000444 /LENGTH=226 /DNA_ID=CAMNT_0013312413 /DNA_START=212 /DNA_END=892 /DNA_ORIENTATION=+
MTHPNEKARFHRERSNSDHTNSSHNPSDITMRTDITVVGPQGNKTAITGKKHSHPQSHRHGNRKNRPRSKSCDRHRRPLPTHVHKKKSSAKRGAGAHSPTHHPHGRVSPKSSASCQQLCGRLWIRPVAVSRKPFAFKSASASIQPHVETFGVDSKYNDTFAPISSQENAMVRMVTDSPMFDDEMMLLTSSASSFNPFQRQGSGVSAPQKQIIFGESGKPIRPRHAF